jgi:stearoyl-CoA desaturase (delta-9 desaturase)
MKVKKYQLSPLSCLAFIGTHLGVGLIFITGFSWPALISLVVVYAFQIFGITAGFHRYFSHRSYKTNRGFQFILAWLGTSAAQQGPLWWAAHHREHHLHSDKEGDIHSPHQEAFWYSHFGWVLCPKNFPTKFDRIKDFSKYPELRFLDKFYALPPFILALSLFGVGEGLARFAPQLQTSGLQLVAWGFFLSTVLLYHITFSINSIAHLFGTRTYPTSDHSRNNPLLALLTFGEGWHNNHHRFPSSEKHGHQWWQLDITHLILRFLSFFRIVWQIKLPPHPDEFRSRP